MSYRANLKRCISSDLRAWKSNHVVPLVMPMTKHKKTNNGHIFPVIKILRFSLPMLNYVIVKY